MKIITHRDIQTFSINNMDNAKNKYVNMERLSSGDILYCLTQLKAMMTKTLKI